MPNSQSDLCAATACDRPKGAAMSSIKTTALYERLSKDDGDSSQESNSIATQKRILESYAEQNGMKPFAHWSDDGYSGKDLAEVR